MYLFEICTMAVNMVGSQRGKRCSNIVYISTAENVYTNK